MAFNPSLLFHLEIGEAWTFRSRVLLFEDVVTQGLEVPLDIGEDVGVNKLDEEHLLA